MAAQLGGMHARIVGAHGRRNDAPALEFGQVQKIEGCNARRDAIGSHASQAAARPGEPHEVEPSHDIEDQPCIGTRVERESWKIEPVVMTDYSDPITHVAGDRLSLAEYLARHGVERILVHAYEGSPQQVDAVQRQTAGNESLAAAKIALCLTQTNRTRLSPQGKRMIQPRGNPLQYRQIEIDYIPAHQHVGVEFLHASAECIQYGAFIRAARGTLRHGAIAAIDDQNLVDTRSI